MPDASHGVRSARALSEVSRPLRLADLPKPEPQSDEVSVEVGVCGVCHTELDEIEGRLRPTRMPIVLGHQVIGRVEAVGPEANRFQVGNRVGVGWIHHSDGSREENLSPEFRATGCDVDGGYAEFMTVPQDYAVAIPDNLSDQEAAPLMCAGAIGYRSLRLTSIGDGETLGLMGFGSSAHLVIQTARHLYPNSSVYVFDRSESVREFALSLGGALGRRHPRHPARTTRCDYRHHPGLVANRRIAEEAGSRRTARDQRDSQSRRRQGRAAEA